nr:hypothetical protein Iba_chr02cCG10420 [Ipomoea batatas]
MLAKEYSSGRTLRRLKFRALRSFSRCQEPTYKHRASDSRSSSSSPTDPSAEISYTHQGGPTQIEVPRALSPSPDVKSHPTSTEQVIQILFFLTTDHAEIFVPKRIEKAEETEKGLDLA